MVCGMQVAGVMVSACMDQAGESQHSWKAQGKRLAAGDEKKQRKSCGVYGCPSVFQALGRQAASRNWMGWRIKMIIALIRECAPFGKNRHAELKIKKFKNKKAFLDFYTRNPDWCRPMIEMITDGKELKLNLIDRQITEEWELVNKYD